MNSVTMLLGALLLSLSANAQVCSTKNVRFDVVENDHCNIMSLNNITSLKTCGEYVTLTTASGDETYLEPWMNEHQLKYTNIINYIANVGIQSVSIQYQTTDSSILMRGSLWTKETGSFPVDFSCTGFIKENPAYALDYPMP